MASPSARPPARPGLTAALAELEHGHADGLLIAKLDRLTRSVRDLGDLVDHYFATRFSLLSVSDSIDTRTPAGRLVLHVLAAVSQWECEATAERTRDALAMLRAEGVTLGGEGFGWRRSEALDDKGRRVLEDIDAETRTLERIEELDALGFSVPQIVPILEAEGRKTKRGGRWHVTTVQRILKRRRASR